MILCKTHKILILLVIFLVILLNIPQVLWSVLLVILLVVLVLWSIDADRPTANATGRICTACSASHKVCMAHYPITTKSAWLL